MLFVFRFFFFFSSRRRHTRWTGDWSSDVCSSDLFDPALVMDFATLTGAAAMAVGPYGIVCMGTADEREIGRATCRERVKVCASQFATQKTLFHVLVGCGLLMLKVSRLKLPVIGLLVSMWLNTLTKSQIWTLLLKV